MEIRFEASFEKDLKKIRDKKLLKQIREVIEEVKLAKGLKDITDLKKLKGYETFYRIRLGDYRIGIDIVENKVIFTRFLHRKEIYKYFP
ncbi:MAG: type II toxin-antitoxin system RelE/ParE family toxin [Anaerolineae bacterium]|nr:type II toxin-antitoxin system RelE/ParE family toxin [Anaerolineales bacterium]MCQ3975909.1 type II toxin-antitoxin system RelE/ParE family toxin [Anaerolineae bacterium]